MAKNSKKTSTRRTVVSESARIRVLAKENPCRKGTGRFDNVARIIKHNGKTVAEFVKHGGKVASLTFAAQQGWAKIATK